MASRAITLPSPVFCPLHFLFVHFLPYFLYLLHVSLASVKDSTLDKSARM